MSELSKVLITVKTYPTLSIKYDELVCTAGVRDDGSWVRIYPLPFRKLEYENRYQKYQWIELPLERNTSDPRPESHKVSDISKLKLIEKPIDTAQGWRVRKEIILKKSNVYTRLATLISLAKDNKLSLAIFKPTRILDFVAESAEREWDSEHLALLKQKASQFSLFQTEDEVKQEFSIVKKLPYKFSYRFCDEAGQESTLMIEDWEIGALYWNCLENSGDEKTAVEKVRAKYMTLADHNKHDLYLFLGTIHRFHFVAPNPFVIVGVFYPPAIRQPELL